jgi:uncharacterized protein
MMVFTITPLYAGVLTILFLILSVRTIRLRRTARVAVGVGSDMPLQRAVRAHGNFAEYSPLALILLGLLEVNEASPLLLHACGVLFVLGRVLHAYGISNPNENFRWRVSGMGITFTTLGVLAGFNLFYSSS